MDPVSIVSTTNTKEGWVQRVLERLKTDLWSTQKLGVLGQLEKGRIEAILGKLRDELWSLKADTKDRDVWANQIVEKLRTDLWASVGSSSKRQASPEEEKRVEAILVRLKRELWAI